jgi:hypothetical protein
MASLVWKPEVAHVEEASCHGTGLASRLLPEAAALARHARVLLRREMSIKWPATASSTALVDADAAAISSAPLHVEPDTMRRFGVEQALGDLRAGAQRAACALARFSM